MNAPDQKPPSKRSLTLLLVMPLVFFGLLVGWVLWAETHPDLERDLRVTAQAQLEDWLPEATSPEPGMVGFRPASEQHQDDKPGVILIHGLDEPGGIWDDLGAALANAGMVAWEFRYPNDQAIDASSNLLAEQWPSLDSEKVFLVGHSMGGLVIRDFVTRHLYAADAPRDFDGPEVGGIVLIGTPNQGSEWARLRAWLEIREWMSDLPEGEASLFAGLRDGTGAAKIDLRPGSRFLRELNARQWPQTVPVLIIGGLLTEPTSEMMDGLRRLADDLGLDDLRPLVEKWWRDAGEGIGDGAVPVESLSFEGGPEPLILPASHRGLVRRMPFSDEPPPAIQPTIDKLEEWRNSGQ